VSDLAHEARKVPAKLTDPDPLRLTWGRLLLFSNGVAPMWTLDVYTREFLGQRIARAPETRSVALPARPLTP